MSSLSINTILYDFESRYNIFIEVDFWLYVSSPDLFNSTNTICNLSLKNFVLYTCAIPQYEYTFLHSNGEKQCASKIRARMK